MNAEQDYGSFEIAVDFKKGSGDPTRVFRAMSGLIESVQSLDQHLSYSIGAAVRTTVLLQDIQVGSLKAKLRTIVEEIPDEALKKVEIKPIIGHFLVKAKHRVVDWCSDKQQIANKDEIKQLQFDIKELAQETDIKQIPAYAEPDTESLLTDIDGIRTALTNLEVEDSASYNSYEGISRFNKQMQISTEIIQEYLTRETLVNEGEKILKVKKPDYLGSSMWVFKYQGKSIDAKILDENWLKAFQGKQISVLPGDSIKAVLRERVSYGHDNEVVHSTYEVVRIIGVLPVARPLQQISLTDS